VLRRFAFIVGVLLVFSSQHVDAVITAPTPLKKFEGDAIYILVGKVEKHFPDKPALMVTAIEDIKGKAPFRQLPINCKVEDPEDYKKNLIEPLLKRFGPDMEIVFFLTPHGKKSYITFAFANGTWFQLQGTKVDKDQVVFNLKSAEPYFRKAFKGTTAELRGLLKEHAAGKAKLPELDDKEKPGLGPEYAPKKGAANPRPQESLRSSWRLAANSFHNAGSMNAGGPLFAVIPTIGLGAPLAILALLFPTLFGGVFVLFRQWLAFITLISLNSTLLIGQWLLNEYYPTFLRGSWWGTNSGLWFMMTLFTCVCAVWAWRRQLNALSDGEREAPWKTELLVLAFMALSCVATTIVLWCMAVQISWAGDIGWTLTVVMTLGVLAGTVYKFRAAFVKPVPFGTMPITTEGVILGAMLLGHLAFVPAILGGNVATGGSVEGTQQTGTLSAKVDPVVKRWNFPWYPEENDKEKPWDNGQFTRATRGVFTSPPLIQGDAVFAVCSLTTQKAVLVRLDRHTGKLAWECFAKDDDLRQLISRPCLSGGKLYFGEGFHDDQNCHVFCIDAETGDEVWRFKTKGQTESSPAVAHGNVYIGAGNDGLYCLDARNGQRVWRFPAADAGPRTQIAYQGRLLRFGAGMAVVGNRLYCGTGVDRNQKVDKGETAVFCFDATDGKLLWKAPAPFPVWSTPVVKDGLVYVATGNGDMFTDAAAPDKPGGAVQCLDAETGAEKWRITLGNGVIQAPAVDAHRVYFGCRDGHVYCLNRADGKERWKLNLESPVVATPVLDCDPIYERTLSMFVASSAGKVWCLNPRSGAAVWKYDLTRQKAVIVTAPRLVVTRTADGYTRQLYFGCGLGGGTGDYNANRPVFYCLEDQVQAD